VSRTCGVLLALLFAAALPTSAQAPEARPAGGVIRETELDRMTKEVAAQLRCVVCQGLSIQDSPSSLAQEMRAVVREQLELGKSPDEVKEYFVEKYGEWVLLQPKARGFNLLVYVMPVLILVGGAAFIYSKARKWTNAAPADVEDEVEAQQY
jgi:cytochrome c-type biogenesis protein CcmH